MDVDLTSAAPKNCPSEENLEQLKDKTLGQNGEDNRETNSENGSRIQAEFTEYNNEKERQQIQPGKQSEEMEKEVLESDVKSSKSKDEIVSVDMTEENGDENPGASLHMTEAETLDNIYDDTKPKRLKQSKVTKADLESKSDRFMQGIDKLISPDELTHKSPTRRKGMSGTSSQFTGIERDPDITYDRSTGVSDKNLVNGSGNNSVQYSDENINPTYSENKLNLRTKFSEMDNATEINLKDNDDASKNIGSDYGTESGYRSDSSGESNTSGYRRKELNNSIGNYPNKIAIPPKDKTRRKAVEDPDSMNSSSHQQSNTFSFNVHNESSNMLTRESDIQREPPRRKSADANLGRQNELVEERFATQTGRKRRVSFGMVAYVRRDDEKEHAIAPLNDEVNFIVDSNFDPTTNDPVLDHNMQFQLENSEELQVDRNILKTPITLDVENFDADRGGQIYQPQTADRISNRKHGYNNPAYVIDRTDTDFSTTRESELNDMEEDNRRAAIELQDEKLRAKKLSKQLFIPGTGLKDTKRLSLQSDESPVPKSILKNKNASSDSLASETSVNEKRFKVRKDSIALFTDQRGQLGLAQLQKPYASWKHRFNLKRIWSKRKEFLSSYKTNFFVFGIFVCILTFVIVGLHLHSRHKESLAIAQKVFFDAKARRLQLFEKDKTDQVSGMLGLNIPKWMLPSHCYQDYEKIHDKTCLIWKDFGQLDIQFMDHGIKCYNVSWKMNPGVIPNDCFNIGNSYWYGPSNSTGNGWPIGGQSFSFDTSSSKHSDSGTFAFVTEYYWLSTNGGAIFVDSRFPLHVSWNKQNDGNLCFSVSNSGDFFWSDKTEALSMSYTVCKGNSITATNNYINEKFIPNLEEIPDISLMMSPHWSTTSDNERLKVNESVILELTAQLKENNLNCSTIELDGQWEHKIGDFSFDRKAFPNVTRATEAATGAKCEVSLHLFPYFDISSRNFPEGLSRELFVKSIGKQVPALIKWQYGVGAMLDVSNSSAREWFTNKVRYLKSSYGIKTFRFAYGNSFWLPHKPIFSQSKLNPNIVKQLFTDLFSKFGDIVVESTSQTQHISGFIGIASSIINHEKSACLKNIISDVLNLGHLGYPLVMSDGFEVKTGNDKMKDHRIPSRDLFIRWMQLSVFFPSMRFTIKPWEYDQEVVSLSRNLSKIHQETVINEIKKLEKETLQGKPIIRPLWWSAPSDRYTFQINDQFLLGEKYLVAPILCEGKAGLATRDIYFPKGIWRDEISKTLIPGPKWIRGYNVTQNVIPYFKQEELHSSFQ